MHAAPFLFSFLAVASKSAESIQSILMSLKLKLQSLSPLLPSWMTETVSNNNTRPLYSDLGIDYLHLVEALSIDSNVAFASV